MHPNQSTPNTFDQQTEAHKRPLRIAIVGAGCTGLRIATLFKKLNAQNHNIRPVEVTVFEAKDHFGGFLQSNRNTDKLVIESGAQGVLSSRISFLKTLEDIGLAPQDVISPPQDRKHSRRFVISPTGKMASLTPNPIALWRSGLLNPLQLIRIFIEFFFIRRKTPLEFNETLYAFFQRHFGRACAEHLIIPFATGIWGGGSEKLLLRHAFPNLARIDGQSTSVLRHVFLSTFFKTKRQNNEKRSLRHAWPKGLLSFPLGMHVLIEKMIGYLNSTPGSIQFNLKTQIVSVAKSSNGEFLLNEKYKFDSVFWTTGAWNTPNLILNNSTAQADWNALQETPTHHLIVCNVSGNRNSRTCDGFGVLANRASDGLLGVLFTHSIYPEHVPKDTFSYRVLLGGDRNPDMVHWDDEQIRLYCLEKLKDLSLIPNENAGYKTEVVRWKRAVGLTDINHDERLAALWRIEACFPDLYFAGIYKKGIGVADAFSSAEEAFERWLSAPRPNH